jgi:hypothetical protein
MDETKQVDVKQLVESISGSVTQAANDIQSKFKTRATIVAVMDENGIMGLTWQGETITVIGVLEKVKSVILASEAQPDFIKHPAITHTRKDGEHG